MSELAYGTAVKITAPTLYNGLVGMVTEDKGEDSDGDAGVLVQFYVPVGHATRVDPEPTLFWHDELETVEDWDLYDQFVDSLDEETAKTLLKAEARGRGYWMERYNELPPQS